MLLRMSPLKNASRACPQGARSLRCSRRIARVSRGHAGSAEGCIDAGSSSAWSSCGLVASSSAGRCHIEVELVEGQRIGLRTLDSERARCRSLDDSLAVIVALLVEASDDMIADA